MLVCQRIAKLWVNAFWIVMMTVAAKLLV